MNRTSAILIDVSIQHHDIRHHITPIYSKMSTFRPFYPYMEGFVVDVSERIFVVKVINDLIDEIEILKARLDAIEELGATSSYRSKLAKRIARHFSDEEIDGLAFDLELNGDYERADSRAGKSRNLVLACDRRSMLPDLVSLCRSQRPRADWPMV